ncbi:MAG: GTPase ObgE, partial [Bacteroidaceae bacterium]
LREFNQEILNKKRILAITKCDLIDEELQDMLKQELPQDLPTVFISAPTMQGITELKDIIWQELNSESNKISGKITVEEKDTLIHRNLDIKSLSADFAGWEDDFPDDFENTDNTDFDDDDILYIE